MSIYSTRTFTRRKALKMLQDAISDPYVSREVLGDMLDGLLETHCENALVVDDDYSGLRRDVEDLDEDERDQY